MLAILVVCFLAFCVYWGIKNAGRNPTPPGPRGLPILGNALQISNEYTWLTFTRWAKEYGQYTFKAL